MIVCWSLDGKSLCDLVWVCLLRLFLDRLSNAHTCNVFAYDPFGDHYQTCQTKSVVSQVHGWVLYKLGTLLGSVGHRVKIHNITPETGKERGDVEIKDYGFGVHIYTLWANLRTQDVQMVLLTQMRH
jgi:hypothetical protein